MIRYGVHFLKGVVAYDPILSQLNYMGSPDHEETQSILTTKIKTYGLQDMHNNSAFDLTLPGYNYLGPGTPTIENILSGKLPVDEFDLAAMVHDIEYLSGETYHADYNMYLNTSGLKALATNLIFNFKDQLIFLNSYIAKPDLAAYVAAKKYVIENKIAPESMFLSGKPKDLQEPGLLYKLMHPVGTISSAITESNILKSNIYIPPQTATTKLQ